MGDWKKRMISQRVTAFIFILGFFLFLFSTTATEVHAQVIPRISVEIGRAESPEDVSVTVQVILLLTVLSLAPAIIIMLTSFTRIIVVFSFLRHAIGTQQMPPNQLLIGLALFLTFFVMAPTFREINQEALQPYLKEEITQMDALKKAFVPLREFMLNHTREKDIALFVRLSGMERPQEPEDLPATVIIPSFVISELNTAFQMGFVLFIPFLIIDMVVASVLLSMGMMMLPPIMVSLPFKILLFVLIDGWNLLVQSMITSFL